VRTGSPPSRSGFCAGGSIRACRNPTLNRLGISKLHFEGPQPEGCATVAPISGKIILGLGGGRRRPARLWGPSPTTLVDFDLEVGVGMLVAPVPLCLLILWALLGKIVVFMMVLFLVRAVGLLFLAIPLMIVIVDFIVVSNRGGFGTQH
jgi:hypothetical protein